MAGRESGKREEGNEGGARGHGEFGRGQGPGREQVAHNGKTTGQEVREAILRHRGSKERKQRTCS